MRLLHPYQLILCQQRCNIQLPQHHHLLYTWGQLDMFHISHLPQYPLLILITFIMLQQLAISTVITVLHMEFLHLLPPLYIGVLLKACFIAALLMELTVKWFLSPPSFKKSSHISLVVKGQDLFHIILIILTVIILTSFHQIGPSLTGHPLIMPSLYTHHPLPQWIIIRQLWWVLINPVHVPSMLGNSLSTSTQTWDRRIPVTIWRIAIHFVRIW